MKKLLLSLIPTHSASSALENASFSILFLSDSFIADDSDSATLIFQRSFPPYYLNCAPFVAFWTSSFCFPSFPTHLLLPFSSSSFCFSCGAICFNFSGFSPLFWKCFNLFSEHTLYNLWSNGCWEAVFVVVEQILF